MEKLSHIRRPHIYLSVSFWSLVTSKIRRFVAYWLDIYVKKVLEKNSNNSFDKLYQSQNKNYGTIFKFMALPPSTYVAPM